MEPSRTAAPRPGLNDLRERGGMTWIEGKHGWAAAPHDVVDALSNDGFAECKHVTTTSRRDLRPAGGVWQGVNTHTGSVASAIWVNHSARAPTIVFITIDGEAVESRGILGLEPDSY